MSCELNGFSFLASDQTTIAKWSQSIAAYGWKTAIEPFDPGDDESAETLFVTLPRGTQPAFAVWRTHSAGYMLADWRRLADGAVDTPMMTIQAALSAIVAAEAGKPGVALPPAIDGWCE